MIALNLREKMVSWFCLHLLFYVVVGVGLVRNVNRFNEHSTLLRHAGTLRNLSLEIRRHENDITMRGSETAQIQVLEYIREGQRTIIQGLADLHSIDSPPQLAELAVVLGFYRDSIDAVNQNCGQVFREKGCQALGEMRALGQRMVTLSQDLVTLEQGQMVEFVRQFKKRLAKTIAFLVALTVVTITLLYTAIIKPLKMVEETANDIANGTFSLLPVDGKKGEVRSVLRAFNKMVLELEAQQEQLFQAKKLSSIGTLASGTAHQINNPLNNIATSCQLAMAEVDAINNPLVRHMLETIERETERASRIVCGLLEFSRDQTFSPQSYSLAGVVRKVELLVAGEVPSDIEFTTAIPGDITLFVDVQKLVEALLNLCINAIQAVSPSSGKVSVSAETDSGHQNALITVVDTGIGINKEHLSKIFDPFFTTKTAKNGTGLGLAVVYGIIKKMDGKVQVESRQGQGTKFTVTLPLHKGPKGQG